MYVECEYRVCLHCIQFVNTREQYLFNWYTSARNLENFYILLSCTDSSTIFKMALFIDKLMTMAYQQYDTTHVY